MIVGEKFQKMRKLMEKVIHMWIISDGLMIKVTENVILNVVIDIFGMDMLVKKKNVIHVFGR
jgi:uncharacterized lipoprotein YajG